MNYSKYKKGYTLLFSIIVASVVLSIAAFILSTSRKQFILSSAARDSTVAIYAADSGIQCAVESFNNQALATTTSPWVIKCNSAIYSGSWNDLNDTTVLSDMGFKDGLYNGTNYKAKMFSSAPIILPGSPNNTCAIVKVAVGYDVVTLRSKTVIESRGYNMGNYLPCSGSATNARAVERAIRLIYSE